jgi:hypothetical protein
MVRQKLALAESWQAVGMSNAGFTHIRGAGQTGTPFCNWSYYAVCASDWNGWW